MTSGSFDVLVVGAGPAGLAVCDALVRAGAVVCLVDRVGDVGGIWNLNNRTTPCHGDLQTVTPAALMGYTGRPMSGAAGSASQADVLKYLRSFFLDQVQPSVDFLTLNIVRYQTGRSRRWRAESVDGRYVLCDWIVLCTGAFWKPRMPSIRSHAAQIHSSDIGRHDFANVRSVSIVGSGNSASDAALTCVHRGMETRLHWQRAPFFVPPSPEWGLPPSFTSLHQPAPTEGAQVQTAAKLATAELNGRFEALTGLEPSGLPFLDGTVSGGRLVDCYESSPLLSIAHDVHDLGQSDLVIYATGFRGWDRKLLRDESLLARPPDGILIAGQFLTERAGFWMFSEQAEAVSAEIAAPQHARPLRARPGLCGMRLRANGLVPAYSAAFTWNFIDAGNEIS